MERIMQPVTFQIGVYMSKNSRIPGGNEATADECTYRLWQTGRIGRCMPRSLEVTLK